MKSYKLVDKVVVQCPECEIDFDTASRRVAFSPMGDYHVSTVFLVLDHNFTHDGPPILFESMCFGPDGFEEWYERCSTWEQAVEMHERMLDRLRDKLKSQMKFDVFDVRGQDDALRNRDTDVGRVFPQIDLRLGNTTIDECERRYIVSSLYSEETDD